MAATNRITPAKPKNLENARHRFSGLRNGFCKTQEAGFILVNKTDQARVQLSQVITKKQNETTPNKTPKTNKKQTHKNTQTKNTQTKQKNTPHNKNSDVIGSSSWVTRIIARGDNLVSSQFMQMTACVS